VTRAQGEAAPEPVPLPAIRRTSLKEIVFGLDQADIRYSESRKFAEIAASMSQTPSVRVAIDGYVGAGRLDAQEGFHGAQHTSDRG
jgi:outer membrane protein OmpA-like peptidoglycan-associated protein